MKKNGILLLLLTLSINAICQVTINCDFSSKVEMSQNLFGAFFEDINYAADGGLYAEMIQNRSFEYYPVSGYTSEGSSAHWSIANSDTKFAKFEVNNQNPLNSNNTNYLKLIISNSGSSSTNSNLLKGKVGLGSWATQAIFDDVKVTSGDYVWIDDSFADASGWSIKQGAFDASNGTYVQSSSDAPAWSIATTEIDNSDYTYTVKAMKTGGSEGFLFPFAYIDDNNYYWINIGGWGNTQHGIEKCQSGIKTTIASVPGSISNNTWYTFKIEVTQTVCKFFMDDVLLFEMTTPSENEIVINESGWAGIANTGYYGMAIDKGNNYNFSTYLKCDGNYSGIVKVNLHDSNGNIIATNSIENITNNWKKYDLQLTSNATSEKAYLSLLFNESATVYADMISLFPEETFMNRKNGLRKDLAETIADLNPRFVRFPGGCVVHGKGIDNAYRWKETVGDVAERTPNWNLWNYHQTAGLGFYEYFLFCEDIAAEPLPVLPIGISCQFRDREIVPIEEMSPWIQDAIDLVEFANGDISTEWGNLRAEMGHPEPFNLKYLCLGNEEDDIPEFRERFVMFQDTLTKYCPEIKIIGTSGTDDTGSYYDSLWQFSKEQNLFAVDEHYYNSPDWFLKNNHRYDSFDRNGPKVFIGEYASQDDKMYNAISEAAYLTGVERNADIIEFTCYAPLLNYQKEIPYHWHPDMILFDNTSVVKTANYYVQQMYGQNTGNVYYNSSINYNSSFEGLANYSGQVGVGTWNTQAIFDDVKVTSGDITIIDQDFNSSAESWNETAGNFSVSGGTYIQSGSETPALSICATTITSSTYTFSLKAKKTSGSEGFLIPFGYKDADNYYWFNLGGWNNSQHAVEICKDGVKSQLMTKSGSLNNNQWYHIVIEITETYSKLYIDDELIFELAAPDGPVTTSIIRDNKTNDLILKIINSSNMPINTTINLGNNQFEADADLIVLKGNPDERNSMDTPNMVAPEKSKITVSDNFSYKLPAYSFSLIRFSSIPLSIFKKTSKNNDNLIFISPNPASDYMNISFNDYDNLHTISLINLQGDVIKTINNVVGKKYTLNRGNIPSGAYIIAVSNDATTITNKVILTK